MYVFITVREMAHTDLLHVTHNWTCCLIGSKVKKKQANIRRSSPALSLTDTEEATQQSFAKLHVLHERLTHFLVHLYAIHNRLTQKPQKCVLLHNGK